MKLNLNLQFLIANLGLAVLWLGYFSPWVTATPVALRLSAHDLVEWLTFVQTVRDGTFPVSRLDLSLPLAGIALLAPFVPTLFDSHTPKRRFLLNSVYLLLGLFAAFLILPAFPYVLTAYNDPELGPQFWLGIVTGLSAIPLAVFAFLRPAWARWLIPVVSLTSIIFAIRAYTLVQPALTDTLRVIKPAPIGYGYVLYLIGGGILLILSTFPSVLKKLRPTQ